jgi:moderate conductance mechanosensitive channel
MPANWPELALALALALLAAYVIANVAARAVRSIFHAILPDEREDRFIRGPGRAIHVFLFLIVAAALSFPALTLAGYQTDFTTDREELLRWLRDSGARSALRIGIVALASYLIIRIGSAAARRFEHEMSTGTGLDVIERTKRAQTLGRLIQRTLAVVVTIVAALIILDELGFPVAPAVTGFGVVGVALGFGAQTLIRDFIVGFFIIAEDQVRVGDSAVVNGQGGLVEEVNLRTIVLRDEQGTVHVFANGEVKTLANMSKDFAYYVLSIGVAYEEDPDRVVQVMNDAGASLMDDPAFRPHILAPLDVYGIDAFEADRLVVKGRIKTVPQKQWLVGRELRKRIARLLRERNIHHMPPRQMNLLVERIPKEAGLNREEHEKL